MLQKHITTTVLFLFTFYILRVRTKICQDIFVINEVSSFENQLKDCTIIAGYLKIVLIENVKASDYEGISFPKLVEIEGYVLVYRVNYLVSLGRLFPNLRVIRGYNLFLDYSLVLYDLEHLEEIGLYNLKYIARGSIRIEKCRRLCYVDTVNWRNILNPAHNITFSNANTDFSCPECPKRCNGLCWNKDHCQVVGDSNGCHPECAAGCYGKDAEHCNACRSYKDGNKCVKRCPKNKFRHSLLPYCVTKQECPKLIPGTWWIFNNECRRDCPSGYRRVSEEEGWCKDCKGLCPKECPGIQVDSIASAEELKGCVYINGELTLRINSAAVADELEKNLGSIEVIDDFLRIHRSYALTTLDFFKNLTLIRGMSLYNNRYGLVIYENPNLHKLANWKNFTIEKGTILFHYNSQLCLSEIDVLAKQLNLNYSEFDVSPYSNGDKKACVYINLNITIVNVTSTTAEFTWEDFALSNETSQLLGYLLYYIEDPFQNATIDDERDECDENNWNSVFVSNTTHEIEKLNAYAQYAYYIKTYVTLPALGGQTKIHYFMTLSDDPINPKIVRAKSESSNSVTLQWNPPEFPNGVLTHYVVVIYFEKDDPKFIARRDYCEHPHHIHTEDTKMSTDVSSTSANNYTCTCKEKPKIQSETFNSLCEKFDDMIRDPKYSGCKRYTYTIESNANGNENENISIVFDTQSLHHLVKRNYIPANSPNILEMNITNPNLTSYVIEGLRHFSMYIILLKACNSPTQCSGPEMVFQRTLKSIKADDIPAGLSINIDNYDVVIRWPEPKDPNSVIVAYNIEYQKTDLENAKAITKCIAREEYAFFGFKYRLGKFLPGLYAIRVQAISLAGFGKFSVVTEFEISPHSHGILTATLAAFVTIAVLIPVFAYCYCSYKQKSNLDQLRLIANVRSNETGSDYIEDEWEMDRDNVDIFKELGQGTFGMVFNGLIKPENRPCAVKTINDQANVHERIAFLNEASVMKSFSDAHHVVKLLGVVSRGNPPLVVMELMERGDLKSYLRRSRSPSTNITCSEMYRMAAEIADGMMYLSAKKFVHRDLAARNCMVSADHTVKIGDFGMTRDIYETDYYRKETGGLMPIRWMSPESLADGVFTSDSDVWSYGVVLWEIVTLAEQPYQGLANEQVLQFVTAQGTLERPLECPDLLYDVMEASWKWRPTHRPTFKDIVEKLEQHIGQHFRLVSFYHSSAGEEYRMNPRDRVYNPPALSVSFNRNSTVYWDALQDDFSL